MRDVDVRVGFRLSSPRAKFVGLGFSACTHRVMGISGRRVPERRVRVTQECCAKGSNDALGLLLGCMGCMVFNLPRPGIVYVES